MMVRAQQDHAHIDRSAVLFDLINNHWGRLRERSTATEAATYWIAQAPTEGQSL